MARVTNDTFSERLLRSAEQAASIKRGETRPARVSRRKVTAREAAVAEPPWYDGKAIAQIRESLGVSQPVFAALLGVAPVTLRKYEQGENEPAGPVRRLLQVAEKRPEVLTAALAPQRGSRARRANQEA
jgi:putative transcriptional regulator